MKLLNKNLFLFVAFISSFSCLKAQDNFPKTIMASDGSIIKIYQPQPESFVGNNLKFRSPFSLQSTSDADPQFGTFWSIATVQTNRDNRTIEVLSIKIPNLKLPSDSDANHLNYLRATLEKNIPASGFTLSQDYVSSSLENYGEEKKLSQKLNNQAPKVIYTNKPSILVLIDGTPQLQLNNDWGLQAIVNTPFTLVALGNQYYLYGNKQWYVANSVTGNYQLASNLPAALNKVQASINSNASTDDAGYTSKDDASVSSSGSPVNIIVSTTPAELVQTNGEADFAAIENTNLMYAKNSSNDLFVDNSTKEYYLLISGRWYKSYGLNQDWQYVEATSLPKDFASIPEGTTKDNVLASVPGTDAARDAVIDAQIPQIAKVDRANAKANVTYDGDPQFKDIEGTSMQYATNTNSSIIKYRGMFYCVENGVWFQSFSASGPWEVCTQRPDEVELIPPTNQLYQVKYVYIYDVNPQYVYMGYTSGYLNNYIYGGRVVYGTGYYYNPWRGHYYYPRAYTWGFGMRYNPWYGWSLGYDYGFGWFNVGFGRSYWNRGYYGGWWGPSCYHPSYWGRSMAGRGLYGRTASFNRPQMGGRSVTINKNYTSNIYNFRKDVVTTNRNTIIRKNDNGFGSVRNNGFNNNNSHPNNSQYGGIKAAPPVRANTPNDRLLTDQEGNVFKKNETGNWMQRDTRKWKPIENQTPKVSQNLEQQQHRIDRGQDRSEGFRNFRNNEIRTTNNAPTGGYKAPNNNSNGGEKNNRSGGRSSKN